RTNVNPPSREHVMIRFSNGIPQHIWYSQHANGQAFAYDTVRKHNAQNLRPLAYASRGSHANYAIPGTHDHTIPNFNLPGGVLEDYTDEGYVYDPLLSAYYYRFDRNSGRFHAYDEGLQGQGEEGKSPAGGWLEWKGRWGDQEYPTSDRRQVKLFGQ